MNANESHFNIWAIWGAFNLRKSWISAKLWSHLWLIRFKAVLSVDLEPHPTFIEVHVADPNFQLKLNRVQILEPCTDLVKEPILSVFEGFFFFQIFLLLDKRIGSHRTTCTIRKRTACKQESKTTCTQMRVTHLEIKPWKEGWKHYKSLSKDICQWCFA